MAVTIFSIYARKIDPDVQAVPDRFSWFAALLPPVYALVHGLWWALAGYAVALVALVALSLLIGGEGVFWLYILFAALIGFEAATLRRIRLARRGYAYGGERIASAEDVAARSWLEHAPLSK